MYFNFCFCFFYLQFLLLYLGIKSSVIGLKTCAIDAEIKKYKSILKKEKKKHDKIVLLVKSILNAEKFYFLRC